MRLSKREQKLIEKGKRLIDGHRGVFFDVFDTLLVRDCASPADVFTLAGQIAQKRGMAQDDGFRERRVAAEQKCVHEVFTPSLEQIYEHLSLEHRAEWKDLEIETEQRLCVRKRIGYELYRYAKEKKRQIVAVSDMYLSSDIISGMLSSAGYVIDTIFVSNEKHCEKFNGALFQIVLGECGLNRKNVVHFGDNSLADGIGSCCAGITFMRIPPQEELSYLKKSGDSFGDRYLMPFIANRIALMDDPAAALGYEVCGPLIVGFCQWLHVKIHEVQYQRVLFCARDMKQTLEIYLRMYPEDRDLVCYTYVSIKSLTLPYRAAKGEDDSEEAMEQLENLRLYMRQIGCAGRIALVDTGMNGRTQGMMTAIMGESCELHGLYLRISGFFRDYVSDRESYAYLYNSQPDMRHLVCASFLETLIAATHGRTNSYSNDGTGTVVPLFGNVRENTGTISKFQYGIKKFTEDYLSSVFVHSVISCMVVQDVFLRLAFFPRLEDVEMLNSVEGGNEEYCRIVLRRKHFHYLLHGKDFFRDLRNTFWKGGFLATVFPHCYRWIGKVYLWLDCLYLNHFGMWDNRLDPD